MGCRLPYSMTGFGAAEGPAGGGTLRIELRSVNHRYLNVTLKAPPEVASLEAEIRDRLRRDFERGHLTISARWVDAPGGMPPGVSLDAARARAALDRLRALQAATGLGGEITLDLLARQPDVFATVEPESPALQWAAIEPILGQAAAACRAMRGREGTALGAELSTRLAGIRDRAALIAARAPERVVRERDRLQAAAVQLLDGRTLDEARLAQEIALMADRLDVTEELVRLEAHLAACDNALHGSRAVGKELGFLAQEIGREINTIGSKANDARMQHAVVEMKGELERFREQLENLE